MVELAASHMGGDNGLGVKRIGDVESLGASPVALSDFRRRYGHLGRRLRRLFRYNVARPPPPAEFE